MTHPLVILCFHRILPESYQHGSDKPYFQRQTALSVERFCHLLDELQKHAAILPPGAIFDWPRSAQTANRPAALLTFDDGYADIVTFALPELQRRKLRAIVCVSTAPLTDGYVFPVDRWYAAMNAATFRRGTLTEFGLQPWSFDLDREEDFGRWIDGPEKRAFVRANDDAQERLLRHVETVLGVTHRPATPKLLDIDGLRTLVDEGFLIGSHGHRHVHLPTLGEEVLRDELDRAFSFFPKHDFPIARIIAYPDGVTNAQTEALARARGFSVGLSLGSCAAMPNDSRMRLPRFIPTNDPTWFARRLEPIFKAVTR
ncbi:MAG: polysaccharide deacetylase family protein [Polyangiaceae bacterium]|nr:polysaccharide deacetylase family protein [Polyangiaceae bacterium]